MRNRAIPLTVLFFISAVFCGLCNDPADETHSRYLDLVEKADSAIKAEDYLSAIDFLSEAIRSEPSNPSNVLLLSNSGMLYYYIGQDSLAMETLNIAHRMAPSSVTVLLNRAKVSAGTGNSAQALADYTLVTELDSTLVDPWIQRGILQLRGGDVRGAEASLAEAAKIEPNSRETYVAFALLYSRTKRPSEAIPYLNKLIKKEPLAEYYAERALCRLALDDLSGASSDIGEGIELDNENPDLYVARALLNKRRFREKDAIADAKLALSKGANPQYLLALGLKLE